MRRPPLLEEFSEPVPALLALCACVGETDAALIAGVEVGASEVPAGFHELLVHEQHMTPKLGAYHGGPVTLEVLTYRVSGDLYNREILLRSVGGAVVEFGIVRLNLACTTPMVREAIVARDKPLGDILNDHRVLTRVEPSWYMRFERAGLLEKYFGAGDGGALYGRIGTIYFHEAPAIELLEIVTDQKHG